MTIASTKGKFHEIDRAGMHHEIDELFTELFKRLERLDVLTTKGDIIVYDGSNAVRLGRGEEGQVLTTRASGSSGLAWEDRASGGDGSTSGGDRRYWLGGLAYGAL